MQKSSTAAVRGGTKEHEPESRSRGLNMGQRVDFDPDALMQNLEYDRELLCELLQAYVEDAPIRLAALTSSVENDEPGGVVTAAHSLKGMSSVIRVNGLEQQALELEMAGRDGDMDKIRTLFSTFQHDLERVLVQAREYLATN
ncbi:Hpt domain-containing protein [Paucidesulfovibrio gracilis]|nr:Hpt domain-containing protein [Paucidesulfovibrio gracilis]